MSKFKTNYERFMNVIGVAGNLMFYFQFYKILEQKSSSSVSLAGFSISVISMANWLLYGILIKNKPLILANAFGTIGAILVTIAILIY